MNDTSAGVDNTAIGQGTKALGALWKYVVQVAIVCLAYIVAGKLGQSTENIRSSNLGPVWPAYGIALAAILIWGYRIWPGVAVGALLVAFFSPVPHVAAFGQAVGATLAAITGAFLLYRVANFASSLSRLRHVLALIAFGALCSALVSASIGVLVLYASHVHAYYGLGSAWLIYWLGDSTGVLLITPLVLSFPDLLKLRQRNRIAEFALLLLLLVATCFAVFGESDLIPVGMNVFAFAVLPFVMWAAIHFGMGGATLVVLVIATTATVETALGHGPFAQNTPFTNAVLLDVFFAVLAVTGMTLAAAIAERERAEHQREQLVRQQGAMEARLAAEKELRESEERLRLAAQVGKMYAYEWDVATDMVVRSPEYMTILGLENERVGLTRQQLLERVHPDDRANYIASVANLTPENPNTHVSYRVVRSDGSVVWLEKNGRAFFDGNGNMQRVIGMVANVTERKLAEEALSNVDHRLVHAEERERSRIARELHDDIAQRLALSVIQLDELRQKAMDAVPELSTRADELQKRLREISTSVQTMSHQLHSPKLEYLGLVAATKSLCKEFAEQQKIEIDFQSHDLPTSLPPEVSLSLFRVLQEALHNAAKHSSANHFDVQLWGESGEVHLVIHDDGRGFNVETAMKGSGLGLVSMRERLRLVNGELSIMSQLEHGTTIHARAPFSSSSDSQRRAG